MIHAWGRGPTAFALLAVCLVAGASVHTPASAQPSLDPVTRPVDDAFGQAYGPTSQAAGEALQQDIDREDIRLMMDIALTRGDVDYWGILKGSGTTVIDARIDAALEFRVLSTDRMRAVMEGEGAREIDGDSSFLHALYLPADVLRSSFAPEVLAHFQERQEDALEQYFRDTFPELELRSLQFEWENTTPLLVVQDDDLLEPPITARVAIEMRYVRSDSVYQIIANAFEEKPPEKSAKKEYVRRLKADAADPLRSRDFFSVAAYTQLLNLSAQPGWALDVELSIPEPFEFTYFNDEVQQEGRQQASLHLDTLDQDTPEHKVFLASITHKRAVAVILLAAALIVGTVLSVPARLAYGLRLRRL